MSSTPLTQQEVIDYVIANAPSYNLDTAAVLAIAQQEGLGRPYPDRSGIGDGGLAYGPWQDHLTQYAERPFYGAGAYNQDVQAWAWSSDGIDYVLGQMSKVAAGKQGKDAVDAIVNKFEIPADPAGEIDRAWKNFTSWVNEIAQQLPSMQGNPDANQTAPGLVTPVGTIPIGPGESAGGAIASAAGSAASSAAQGALKPITDLKQGVGDLLSRLQSPGFWWAVLLFGGALVAIVAGVIIYFKGDLRVGRSG